VAASTGAFYESFKTTHCLIFQTDVLLRRRIPAKFLQYDYVGAPWALLPRADVREGVVFCRHSGLKAVGNGGVSLRKTAAMLEICRRQPWSSWNASALEQLSQNGLPPLDVGVAVNEDSYLSARVPAARLPDNHEAAEFAVQDVWHPNPCGLHKTYTSGEADAAVFSRAQFARLLEVVARCGGNDAPAADSPETIPPYEVKWRSETGLLVSFPCRGGEEMTRHPATLEECSGSVGWVLETRNLKP